MVVDTNKPIERIDKAMAEYKIIEHKVKRKDENNKFVKDEKGHFIFDTVSKEYRIDAEFKPNDVSEIIIDFIKNYCVANNQVDWLIEQLESKETHKKKDGTVKKVDKSFISIRSAFIDKFFPEIRKGNVEKQPTKHETMLAELKAMKAKK